MMELQDGPIVTAINAPGSASQQHFCVVPARFFGVVHLAVGGPAGTALWPLDRCTLYNLRTFIFMQAISSTTTKACTQDPGREKLGNTTFQGLTSTCSACAS